jgi:hypothetical protein
MTTFALVVYYQYAENYAAFDWDGQGECPQGWKMKGEHEEVVKEGITVSEASSLGAEGVNGLIQQSKLGFGQEDNFVSYGYMGHELVEFSSAIVEQVAKARQTSYDPNDAYGLSLETHLAEAQCKWALNQLQQIELAKDYGEGGVADEFYFA